MPDNKIMYVALFVVKILPVLLIGNTSSNKLIVVASKKKFTWFGRFKEIKFLNKKNINIDPIIMVIIIPKIPRSVKISI